jgi:Ca2+-binding EF-hand superfamily protein
VFERLDEGQKGKLSQKEMRQFAIHTGFECTESVWHNEFMTLCRDNDRNPHDGVDYPFFCKLVNDQSKMTGVYCGDGEMQQILTKLGGPMVNKSGDKDRSSLVRAVFEAFDIDQDGRLNREEMRNFAESTGFDGGDAAWNEAYDVLCKAKDRNPSEGVSLEFFASLVNDKHDEAGVYCTDDELNSAVKKAADLKSKVVVPPARPKGAGAPPPTTGAASNGRASLISAVFSALDADKDGKLNKAEMKKFAKLTGFEGSEEEWDEAFQGLCKDAGGGSMVDLKGFTILVDDPSEDTGCHCSDEDLKGMLGKIFPGPPPGGPPGSPPAAGSSRDELVKAVFNAMDKDRDGILSGQEIASFGEAVGANEGESLRAAFADGNKLDLAYFNTFVSDKSADPGCFLSDQDLRDVLGRMSFMATMSIATQGRSKASGAKPPDAARMGMIRSVFQKLDVDGDGKLNVTEMRKFAEQQDFEGSDDDFKSAYNDLCTEKGRDPAQMVDLDLFTQLVNDESEDSGAHCTDDELKLILSRL